jgi:hypothetical protein
MARKAFAKRCCSGDSDAMASLNSLGVGSSVRDSGICTSSLSFTITADTGSKVVAEEMRPTRSTKQENWRAEAVRVSAGGGG